MGKKIFGNGTKQNKWLVKHVQPFETNNQLPIINCIFSDKFLPYINKQYCLTDDFYNQLQGKKILTGKGWEVDPTCVPRKDLMNKILNDANAPNDIGIIDVNKKTFFSFCSSQTMARAYQCTIFQLIKKSLVALNYATDAIFDSQSNSRTRRILNNVNNKLALLKNDKVKRFNLVTQISEQYDLVVLPFQEVIEIGLTTDKAYIVQQSQPEEIEEPDEPVCEEQEDITMEENFSDNQLHLDPELISDSTENKPAPPKPDNTRVTRAAAQVQDVTNQTKKSKKKKN